MILSYILSLLSGHSTINGCEYDNLTPVIKACVLALLDGILIQVSSKSYDQRSLELIKERNLFRVLIQRLFLVFRKIKLENSVYSIVFLGFSNFPAGVVAIEDGHVEIKDDYVIILQRLL